jgi:glycosyltransferase involved in cell wall biosynthesis
VIAVSHSLRQAAIAVGVAPAQIEVIPNGVDGQLYSPGDRRQSRAELGIPADEKLIVSVGSLKPVKGHDVLIEAIADLPSAEAIRLVCLGGRSDASWVSHLERKIDRAGVRQRVHLLGARAPEEVVRWLRASDLFTLASRREGCCNAVLEALACGVPVAVTAVGDNDWFVKPGTNGELAPPEDAAALSSAIERALNTVYCTDAIVDSIKSATWQRAAALVAARLGVTREAPADRRQTNGDKQSRETPNCCSRLPL